MTSTTGVPGWRLSKATQPSIFSIRATIRACSSLPSVPRSAPAIKRHIKTTSHRIATADPRFLPSKGREVSDGIEIKAA
jgi:hypothetical protein